MDVTLIQQKQKTIIADFYSRQREKLIQFAAMRLPFPEESEDVVQDVFLRILRHGEMVREETINSFVYTVLRNLINDKLRMFRCHKEVNRWLFEAVETRTERTTEHTVDGNALMQIVETKIRKLPSVCRQVYSLHLFEGLTVDEIVEKSSLTKRAVESYLFQARKKIRKEVVERWYGAV